MVSKLLGKDAQFFAICNGLMFAGDPNGPASEVINCRCVTLQSARWALDEDELELLKERAEYFGLDNTENFKDFQEKYLKATETIETDKKAIYDYMGAKSYIINEKLRKNSELSPSEVEFIEAFDAALDKMPSYEGTLQRSLTFASSSEVDEFMKEYEVG